MEDARRILKSARAFHFKDAEFWDLSIQAAANRAEEEQLYTEMVKLFPEETKYALALGEVRVRRLDLPGAQKVLEPLIKHSTGKVAAQAHYQLARGLFQDKQAQAALKHLEAAQQADTHLFTGLAPFQFKARVHEHLGQVADAIKSYRQALEADADDRDTLAPLIRLEIKANLRSEAIDHLRRYTLLAEKNLTDLARAADFHWQLGRLEDAFELASRTRDLGFHAGAQRILGLVHGRKGEFTQAVFHLDRADLDPEARCTLANAHLALGQVDLATRAAAPGKEQAAAKSDWNERLHQLCKTTQQLTARRDMLLNAVKYPKDQTAAFTRTADAVVCADHLLSHKAARELIDELVRKAFADKVEFGPAYGLRAYVHLDGGQLTKALADAGRALELGPPQSRTLLVHARVHLERGNPAVALADLKRALDLSGGSDPWIHHYLAAALHNMGRLEEALAAQREAVRLSPGEAEFQTQLRELEKARKS
jgi:tetratricopeptide (TPR) repeat protein